MNLKGQRASGILQHLTSLPSGAGIGGLGVESTDFLDFLVDAGQSLWQILPVGPVDRALGGSPYCGVSAFAGNELLVDLEDLVRMRLLPPSAGKPDWTAPEAPVNWDLVFDRKGAALDNAWSCFKDGASLPAYREEYDEFRAQNGGWLEEYSLFCAIKAAQGGKSWLHWPEPLRKRDPKALEEAASNLKPERDRVEFGQWLFSRQWSKLREDAKHRGITLFGDLPIYVGLDSADAWSWQEGFDLEPDGPADLGSRSAARLLQPDGSKVGEPDLPVGDPSQGRFFMVEVKGLSCPFAFRLSPPRPFQGAGCLLVDPRRGRDGYPGRMGEGTGGSPAEAA
jgi:4-alpha-glucanotransferase